MEPPLADQECDTETADEPLEPAEYESLLPALDTDVWDVVDEHHLEASYQFSDFRNALEFTYEVGDLAEEVWHHPDIHLSWGEVGIELWTHEIDGLQRADFVMAARMDRLYDEYPLEDDS